MKKIYAFAAMAVLAVGLSFCSSSKKAAKTAAAAPPKATYAATVAPVIAASCSPCHIAGKGNKKPFDNYANVKTDIDEILRRVNLNPTDKGFMPFKKTSKLAADTIAVFQKFKDDGALEN